MTEKFSEKIWAAIEAIVLYGGVMGIMGILRDIPGITFSFVPVLLGNAFLYCFLYIGNIGALQGKKQRYWILAGCAAICAFVSVTGFDTLAAQGATFFSSLTELAAQGRASDVTFFAVIFSMVVSILFAAAEAARQHWLPYIGVTAVMVGGPLFGIRASLFSLVLLVAFQILFLVIHTANRRSAGTKGGSTRGKGRHTTFFQQGSAQKSRIGITVCAFTSGVLVILLAVSALASAFWGEELAAPVYRGEEFISRNIQSFSYRTDGPSTDGHVSSGNNYRTGETQFVVTLTEEPTETLYLKGFTGGTYTGGEWEPADDMELFRQVSRNAGWGDWRGWVSNLFSDMYFTMNVTSSGEPLNTQRAVWIDYMYDSFDSTFYVSYYSARMVQQGSGRDYGFHYYEESEMDFDWNHVPSYFENFRDWYREIQNGYLRLIPDAYTSVPEAVLPRLTDLCAGREFSSLEETTAFIVETLRSHASYTLTPGRAPLNEDIVEYFLFESHEGYCVHFATAAALMYRLFDVPARYASGYAIAPSDFTLMEDGTWQAEVSDEFSHAWTEIFLEDYGWVPIDATPSVDEEYYVNYPGMDSALFEELLSASLPGSTQEGNQGEEAGTDPAAEDDRESGEDRFAARSLSGLSGQALLSRENLPLFCAAGAALCLLCAVLWKKERRKRLERMSCRQLFAALLKLLHKKGYMAEYAGTEEDFAAKLAEEISCIEKAEAETLTEIVRRAAYGEKEPGQEETNLVRALYFRIEDFCRTGTFRKRK